MGRRKKRNEWEPRDRGEATMEFFDAQEEEDFWKGENVFQVLEAKKAGSVDVPTDDVELRPQCLVCLDEDVLEENPFVPRCGRRNKIPHHICRACAVSFVEHAGCSDVRCPVAGCTANWSQKDLRALGIHEKEQKKWAARPAEEAEVDWSAADADLERMITSGEVQRCPSCLAPTIRNGGCPNMSCSICHRRWTWDPDIGKSWWVRMGGADNLEDGIMQVFWLCMACMLIWALYAVFVHVIMPLLSAIHAGCSLVLWVIGEVATLPWAILSFLHSAESMTTTVQHALGRPGRAGPSLPLVSPAPVPNPAVTVAPTSPAGGGTAPAHADVYVNLYVMAIACILFLILECSRRWLSSAPTAPTSRRRGQGLINAKAHALTARQEQHAQQAADKRKTKKQKKDKMRQNPVQLRMPKLKLR